MSIILNGAPADGVSTVAELVEQHLGRRSRPGLRSPSTPL